MEGVRGRPSRWHNHGHAGLGSYGGGTRARSVNLSGPSEELRTVRRVGRQKGINYLSTSLRGIFSALPRWRRLLGSPIVATQHAPYPCPPVSCSNALQGVYSSLYSLAAYPPELTYSNPFRAYRRSLLCLYSVDR